jgi:hypothetical protein
MDRRAFLRAAGFMGVSGVLAACTRDAASRRSLDVKSQGFDPVGLVAPEAREELSVVSGSFEQLVGDGRPFGFGIVGVDNEPVTAASVAVWVVPVSGGDPTGPFATTFHEVSGQPRGIYVADVDIAVAGPTSFVAVTGDGRAGADTVLVATPATSQLPAPTQNAIAVPTPTTADQMGMQKVCTLTTPCGMHEVSLAQMLAEGRPVVLEFATPAYCQTAVCGPSVEVLDDVRTDRDWGDVAFIHVEIYRDAGQTIAEPVEQWGLPSEPWLFAIGADGTIEDRMDGPLLTLPAHVAGMIERLS